MLYKLSDMNGPEMLHQLPPRVRQGIISAMAARAERELRDTADPSDPDFAFDQFRAQYPELGEDHSVDTVVKASRPRFTTEVSLTTDVL